MAVTGTHVVAMPRMHLQKLSQNVRFTQMVANLIQSFRITFVTNQNSGREIEPLSLQTSNE